MPVVWAVSLLVFRERLPACWHYTSGGAAFRYSVLPTLQSSLLVMGLSSRHTWRRRSRMQASPGLPSHKGYLLSLRYQFAGPLFGVHVSQRRCRLWWTLTVARSQMVQ